MVEGYQWLVSISLEGRRKNNMVQQWDADDSNEEHNLQRYFTSLTQHQKDLVKGLFRESVPTLLKLNEKDFKQILIDSLSLKETTQLSKERLEERQKLMLKITAVWKYNQEKIELQDKDRKQNQEVKEENEKKCWIPMHQELE